MARRSKSSKGKKRKKKSRKVRISSDPLLLSRIASSPLWNRKLGYLFLSAVLTGIAAHSSLSYVREDESLYFRSGEVALSGLPEWLDDESKERLRSPPEGILPDRIHVLNRKPLRDLRRYYKNNEWVVSVERLEYIFPGKNGEGGIVARLELCDPLCAVGRGPREYYYADWRGRRLGGAVRKISREETHLPVVCWASRVPERGERWGAKQYEETDDPVLHGFYVAAVIAENNLRSGLKHWISRIMVGNVGSDYGSEVELRTEPGHDLRIQWGRTKRSEVVHHRLRVISTEEKVRRLRKILSGEVRVDPGREIRLFESLRLSLGTGHGQKKTDTDAAYGFRP